MNLISCYQEWSTTATMDTGKHMMYCVVGSVANASLTTIPDSTGLQSECRPGLYIQAEIPKTTDICTSKSKADVRVTCKHNRVE